MSWINLDLSNMIFLMLRKSVLNLHKNSFLCTRNLINKVKKNRQKHWTKIFVNWYKEILERMKKNKEIDSRLKLKGKSLNKKNKNYLKIGNFKKNNQNISWKHKRWKFSINKNFRNVLFVRKELPNLNFAIFQKFSLILCSTIQSFPCQNKLFSILVSIWCILFASDNSKVIKIPFHVLFANLFAM